MQNLPETKREKSGHPAWNKGKSWSPEHIENLKIVHNTPETKEKHRIAANGQVCTQETREKLQKIAKDRPINWAAIEAMRNANVGRKKSPPTQEQRERIGAAQRGRKASPETKAKMSASQKGRKMPPRTQEYRDNMSKSKKGTVTSEATKEKLSTALKGEKSYRWRGGITSLYHAIRTSKKCRNWKNSVFGRDNYTDMNTGEKSKHTDGLNAHHKIPFAVLLKRYHIKTVDEAENCTALWDINNGETMTKENHEAFHKEFKFDESTDTWVPRKQHKVKTVINESKPCEATVL